ncbi:MAG: hypothetical protein JWO26_1794, partial [Rhodospirillales bacterium]|nr:hypothetical protein [Rhodospirillales bacterium]
MTSLTAEGDQMTSDTLEVSAPLFAGSDPLFIDFG